MLHVLDPEEQRGLQAMIRALERWFSQPADRRQKKKESLGVYAAEVLLYTRRGYQDYPAAARQDVALHAFLRGLKPERLGQHVRLARPQTLAVVLDEAHLWRWFWQRVEGL